jgi:hypothetical protein
MTKNILRAKQELSEQGKLAIKNAIATPKWIFMRIRTYSYLAQMHVYLAWTFKVMHMDPDTTVCQIPSTYVGMQ